MCGNHVWPNRVTLVLLWGVGSTLLFTFVFLRDRVLIHDLEEDLSSSRLSHAQCTSRIDVVESRLGDALLQCDLQLSLRRAELCGNSVEVTESIGIPGLVLLTSYHEPENVVRLQELRDCLQHNVNNKFIDEIHLLVEPEVVDFKFLSDPSSKLRVIRTPIHPERDRFSTGSSAFLYSDFFEYANSRLRDSVTVLSNSDIMFDETIGLLDAALLRGSKKVYALSRENKPCDVPCEHLFCKPSLCDDYRGSHDAFVFMPPLAADVAAGCDHPQNRRGAENVVIFELQNSGYNVTNPCRVVKLWHHHCVRDVTNYLASARVDESPKRHGRANPTDQL